MSQKTIIATGPIDQFAADMLSPFGEIRMPPDETEATLISMLPGAVALVLRAGGAASARVIDAGSSLKVIGRTGAGYETVDVAAATRRGIPVVYTPGASARAVAEAAMTFLLALCKRLAFWDRQVKSGNWGSRLQSRAGDLEGATLGIVGLGAIGQILATLAKPFQMNLVAYDPYASPARAQELGVRLVGWEELLQTSDFVSLHAPLTEETKGLINPKSVQLMKRGAVLVNLARGGLVDSLDTLHDALVSGQLAGVGLDVFQPEPPDASHPIFRLENCLTAPHALATSERAMSNIFRSMAEDMVAVFRGERPRFVANPAVFDEPAKGRTC